MQHLLLRDPRIKDAVQRALWYNFKFMVTTPILTKVYSRYFKGSWGLLIDMLAKQFDVRVKPTKSLKVKKKVGCCKHFCWRPTLISFQVLVIGAVFALHLVAQIVLLVFFSIFPSMPKWIENVHAKTVRKCRF